MTTLNLGSYSPITAAVTNRVLTSASGESGATQAYLSGLTGLISVGLYMDFNFGAGSGTGIVRVYTRFNTLGWINCARFDFANVSVSKDCNIAAFFSQDVREIALLSAEGIRDGTVGEDWYADLTTTGTYTGTNNSVSLRLVPRRLSY